MQATPDAQVVKNYYDVGEHIYILRYLGDGLAMAFEKAGKDFLVLPYPDTVPIAIRKDPSVGEPKRGELAGYMGYDIHYNKTNYELAYTVVEDEKGEAVVIIMAGTRQNFYEELKNYIKKPYSSTMGTFFQATYISLSGPGRSPFILIAFALLYHYFQFSKKFYLEATCRIMAFGRIASFCYAKARFPPDSPNHLILIIF